MSRKTQVEWLISGPDPYLATCERCGQHVAGPGPLPIPVKAFIKYMEYAVELHRYCEPPESAKEGKKPNDKRSRSAPAGRSK